VADVSLVHPWHEAATFRTRARREVSLVHAQAAQLPDRKARARSPAVLRACHAQVPARQMTISDPAQVHTRPRPFSPALGLANSGQHLTATPATVARNPPEGATMISKLDFVGVPSQDAERSRAFYVDTLGLRPDDKARFDFWVGGTCFGIWEPASFGMPFAPQKNAHPALHVDDVAVARAELEAKGVEFAADTLDTGVCHMALFTDPDGNDLMLHSRYAPRD